MNVPLINNDRVGLLSRVDRMLFSESHGALMVGGLAGFFVSALFSSWFNPDLSVTHSPEDFISRDGTTADDDASSTPFQPLSTITGAHPLCRISWSVLVPMLNRFVKPCILPRGRVWRSDFCIWVHIYSRAIIHTAFKILTSIPPQ